MFWFIYELFLIYLKENNIKIDLIGEAMDELTKDILSETMKFVFNLKVNELVSGKYEPPNMVDKCVDDINNTWTELIRSTMQIED